MANRNFRRSTLIGSASLLALAFGTSGQAAAQTVTDFTLDLISDPLAVTGSVAGANVGNSIDAQGTLLGAHQSSSSASLVDNNAAGDVTIGVDPAPYSFTGNAIYAIGSANNSLNLIGLLPAAPVGFQIDGVAILQGQVSDEVGLYAEAVSQLIQAQVLGEGATTATFTDNSISARASFNRSLNSIEVPSSTDLQVPASASSVDFGLPTTTQSATFSVASVQLNTDFTSDSSGGPDDMIARLADPSILFNRINDAAVPSDLSLAGSFDLSSNAIEVEANSNNADNSVLVTDADALSFQGTAFVTNLQASQDLQGTGIDSSIDLLTTGARILFNFQVGALGPADIGTADGLTLTVEDNAISAQSIINSARNEVSFAGGLVLDGVLDEPTNQIIRMTGGTPDRVEADYAVSSIQAVADFDAGTPQAASATINLSQIGTTIEDVSASSSLTMSGNAIGATAGANGNLNILGNGDGGATSIDGVGASFNYQYAAAPLIDASVTNGYVYLLIGSDGGSPVLDDPFGGFTGASLAFAGNAVSASAFGNQAQSQTSFTALDLTMEFANGANPNDAANLNSENGEAADVENYRASAGSAMLSYQQLDLAGGDVTAPSISASVSASTLLVSVNTDTNLPADGLGLGDGTIDVTGNQLSASAAGNSFAGLNALTAVGSFTGTGAILAVQEASGQNADASLTASELDVLLSFDATVADNLQLGVEGNSATALASINSISTQNSITALTAELGADGTNANARIYGSTDPTQIAGRNRARADSGLTTLTDQFNAEGSALATVDGVDVTVTIADSGAGALNDFTLSFLGNTIGAQSRGNQATNSTTIDVATTVSTVDLGAFAGIVSQQVNTNAAAPDVSDLENLALGAGGLILANTIDSNLTVTVPTTGGGDLAINSNRTLANAAANLASNSLTITASTLAPFDALPTGGNLAVTSPSATDDIQLDVAGTGAFIMNSQRNEALDPGPNDAPLDGGPATIAILGNADLATGGNSLTFSVGDGVTPANLTDSTLGVSGNAMLASARANDATNALTITASGGGTDAGVLNNQINSGSVFALNNLSNIETNLTGTANDTISVSMLGNQIGSSAFGSNATNSLTAASATGFGSTAQSGGPGAPVAVLGTPGTVVINNGDLDANGNLVVLNTQTSYSAANAPQQIAAATSNATIALNASGQATAGTFSFSGNGISANASANLAANSITTSGGTGGLPSATLVSVQHATGAAVSASVTDSSITASLGGGANSLVGGGASFSGNVIGATASINSSSSVIGAPGQTFTRTSSF